MNSTTRILLVRHGETIWNSEGRIQGHLDSELTERGIAQAESVASRLAGAHLDGLYSSDLGRAWKTAERISASTGCPVTMEPRLRERALGIFEGLNESEIRQRYPAEWTRFQSRDPDFQLPGGETSHDRVRRSNAVLEDIAGRHAGGIALLVTHGGILDAIFRLVVGLPLDVPRQFKIWNAGINLISRPSQDGPALPDTGGLENGGPASAAGGGWMIELWGDTGTVLDGKTLDDT